MASLIDHFRQWTQRRRQVQIAGDNSVMIQPRGDLHLAAGLASLRAVPLWDNPYLPARHGGICSVCGEIIAAGDPITHDGGTEIHQECAQ